MINIWLGVCTLRPANLSQQLGLGVWFIPILIPFWVRISHVPSPVVPQNI